MCRRPEDVRSSSGLTVLEHVLDIGWESTGQVNGMESFSCHGADNHIADSLDFQRILNCHRPLPTIITILKEMDSILKR